MLLPPSESLEAASSDYLVQEMSGLQVSPEHVDTPPDEPTEPQLPPDTLEVSEQASVPAMPYVPPIGLVAAGLVLPAAAETAKAPQTAAAAPKKPSASKKPNAAKAAAPPSRKPASARVPPNKPLAGHTQPKPSPAAPPTNATQGDLLMAAKARRQAQRVSPPPLPHASQSSSSDLPSSGLSADDGRLPPPPPPQPPLLPPPPAAAPASPRAAAPASFFGGWLSALSIDGPPDATVSQPAAEAALPPPLSTTTTTTPSPAPHASSALCFVAGHLDLLSACALACTHAETHAVLSPWLQSLRSSRVDGNEPLHRLRAAASSAAALPQLVDLYVADGRRLDVRWLTGATASAASRNTLNLVASVSSGGSVPTPSVAFAVVLIACRLASSFAREYYTARCYDYSLRGLPAGATLPLEARLAGVSSAARRAPLTVTRGTFATVAALSEWLELFGVDTTSWGVGKAKTVKHLLKEVNTNEATLTHVAGKCFRRLSVVKTVVRQPGAPKHYLACYEQTMDDGRVRERNQLPSEKQIAGEAVARAAERCLLEELGGLVSLSCIEPLETSLVRWDELVDSPSYPGLTTQYKLSQMECVVHGLPEAPRFVTKEGPVKQHAWEWRQDGLGSLVRPETVDAAFQPLRRIVPWRATDVDIYARKLDLRNRALGDAGLGAVCGVLAGMPMLKLREVVLTANRLSDAGVAVLASAIAGDGYCLALIRSLELGDNRVGPEGARALAAAMCIKGAAAPDAYDADLSPAGAARDARHPLERLGSLNLEGNLLGDAGVAALAPVLAAGALPALEVLNLSRNGITQLAPLTAALSTGAAPHMRRLLLQANPLADGQTRDLQASVGASTPKQAASGFTDSGSWGGSIGHKYSASATLMRAGAQPTGVAVRVRGAFQPAHERMSAERRHKYWREQRGSGDQAEVVRV